MISSDECIGTAASIGARLCRTAIWANNTCTWTVQKKDARSGTFYSDRANAFLYQGASGIALFLIELAAHTSEPGSLRVAAGALRYSLQELAAGASRARIGLYSGTIGIAYALTRYDCVAGGAEFREAANTLVGSVTADTDSGGTLDLIDGCSGVIPMLLHLHRRLDRPDAVDAAIGLGDRLMSAALHRHGAWSWRTENPFTVDDQVGMAHGSTGVGYALLELARATGEARFLYGAEQAIAYERRHFDTAKGSWHDLRDTEVFECVQRGRFAEMTNMFARTGRTGTYTPRFSTTWCYGAPGIGLARLRAYKILGDTELRDDVIAACATTERAVLDPGGEFVLCHGHAGNCELLLQAADALSSTPFRNVVEQRAAAGRVAFELCDRPWPTANSSERDPSLMVGEAGIGHFYLRLFSPDTPAILLFEPDCEARPFTDFSSYETLRTQCLHEMFGKSLRQLEAWQPNRPSLREEILQVGARHIDPLQVVALIEQRLREEDSAEARSAITGELAVEKAKLELLREPLRLSNQLLANAAGTTIDPIEWTESRFRLGDHVRVIASDDEFDVDAARDPSRRQWHLIYLKNRAVTAQTLQPFAALVLRSVVGDATFDDIVSGIRAATDVADATALVEAVRGQVDAMCRAGLLLVLRAAD